LEAFTKWAGAFIAVLALVPVSRPRAEVAAATHQETGLRFPKSAGGVVFSGLRDLAPSGRDISVVYQSAGSTPVTVTAFVYAKVPPSSRPDETIEAHTAEVVETIKAKYPGAACMPWKVAPRNSRGQICSLETKIDGVTRTLRSLVVIQSYGSFWLKYRATADAAAIETIEKAVGALLKTVRAG
jgi:hypothetical protein